LLSSEEKIQGKYKIFLKRISGLEKVLQDLNFLCHNKLLAYLSPDQNYGSVNSFIQNTLCEQSFIEVLVKILIISFPKVENLQQVN
jgi:hypothetical protein